MTDHPDLRARVVRRYEQAGIEATPDRVDSALKLLYMGRVLREACLAPVLLDFGVTLAQYRRLERQPMNDRD